jgi:hypothetical protein
MSDDVSGDFERLHGTAQAGAEGFDMGKAHPVFGAVHSLILAHKYGEGSFQDYLRNPGLRQMDTRDAALQGMRKAGEGVRRWGDQFRPPMPGPVSPMPGPATTAPTAYPHTARSVTSPPQPVQSPVPPPGHYLP